MEESPSHAAPCAAELERFFYLEAAARKLLSDRRGITTGSGWCTKPLAAGVDAVVCAGRRDRPPGTGGKGVPDAETGRLVQGARVCQRRLAIAPIVPGAAGIIRLDRGNRCCAQRHSVEARLA
jgi:hypothetical protein